MVNDHVAFALESPSGTLIVSTVSADLETAQVRAFDFLYAKKAWAKPFWKQWDLFIKERNKRGWHVRKVRLLTLKIFPVGEGE